MPKKSPAGRGVAQRNKQKGQKSFELVHETSVEQEAEAKEGMESTAASVATAVQAVEKSEKEQPSAPKGSAAARMAARRQMAQKIQQRNAASLITPEHFTYVRKDLITIAVLASVMFAAIIVLYFVIGSRA